MPNRLFGLGLAAFSVLYLVLVVKVVLPWFRGGADVHFANYFSELGGSTDDIVRNLVRDPGRFAGRLCRPESLLFGLALILPLGGLPLLSPGRLAAAAPLFAILCLSDITNDPRHHFHAPLVPIVVWSALAGLGRVAPLWNALLLRGRRHGGEARDPFRKFLAFRLRANGKSLPSTVSVVRQSTPPAVRLAGTWLLFSSLAMGLFFGLSPLAIPFWDPGSPAAWREYVPDRRAQSFPAAFALVPRTARVASTDFVHPRFTHHERSYDYSSYRPVVPPDTEYIVIDTRHPYSTIRRPEQVKEYRDHPRDWELLMRGDFIVLRRRGVAVMP